jgi:FAD dependent oxidoreductase
VQPLTFPFALDWSPETKESNVISAPKDYEELKALQNYHIKHGAMTGLFEGAFPWWSYRRLLAAENFDDSRIKSDLVMINTAGNDFYGGNIIGSDAGDAATVKQTLERARRASLGYVYWLQTECPREKSLNIPSESATESATESPPESASESASESAYKNPSETPSKNPTGYPEFRLRLDVFDTEDGCSIKPYIRESRRIRSLRPILEQEIVVADFNGNPCRADNARACFMRDSIGIGHYALDIHPNRHGEKSAYVPTRPFQIPLGSFISVRLKNLLPACKNLGTTHLTNGAYRLHPIEWNIGESAGIIAALCVLKNCLPRDIHESESLLTELQNELLRNGIPLNWYVDVPLHHEAFMAVQMLACTGILSDNDTDLLFRPDESIDKNTWKYWRHCLGDKAAVDFAGTRAEAAIALYENSASVSV